jgi:protein-disulfide isomerase
MNQKGVWRMKLRGLRVLVLFAGLAFVVVACNKADLEEIKNNQKEILKKIAVLEKKSGAPARPQRPKRPPVDYNKVHQINTEGVASKGAKDAKVTIVEYTDYQ